MRPKMSNFSFNAPVNSLNVTILIPISCSSFLQMKGNKGVDVQVKDSITFRLGQSAPSQHPHMWYGGLGEFSASTEEKKNKISKVKSVTNSSTLK